jgi:hypothetical protein
LKETKELVPIGLSKPLVPIYNVKLLSMDKTFSKMKSPATAINARGIKVKVKDLE